MFPQAPSTPNLDPCGILGDKSKSRLAVLLLGETSYEQQLGRREGDGESSTRSSGGTTGKRK